MKTQSSQKEKNNSNLESSNAIYYQSGGKTEPTLHSLCGNGLKIKG